VARNCWVPPVSTEALDGDTLIVVSTGGAVTVTLAVYGHLTAADARAALEKAGWFTGREVTW